MSHAPTDEQLAAVAAFQNGKSLKVNALAGAGKTSTLKLMAESRDRKGTYLAFNKSIANEAANRFPKTVQALTSHSLAYRGVIHTGFSSGQMTNKLNANAVAQCLGLDDLPIDHCHRLSSRQHAHLVSETVRLFCQSDATSISSMSVPVLGALVDVDHDSLWCVKRTIATEATNLWARMISPKDELVPLGHDGYFKLWAMSRPTIRGDYVLLDEAQDSNPALLAVLDSQEAQVVYVGDPYQQIYEWRGAVNAMERIETSNTVALTQSFRFGPQIADFASRILHLIEPTVSIRGNPRISSKIGCDNPDTILTRTNAALISFVIAALGADRKPHVVGGTQELRWLLEDVSRLKVGQPGTHPEYFGFTNWDQVREFAVRIEGQNLKTFVKIVDQHGERAILGALDKTVPKEEQSDLILSTAHKAKGREWATVMLDEDFFQPRLADEKKRKVASDRTIKGLDGLNYEMGREEIRLLYVASTRAKEAVQIPIWCSHFFDTPQPESKLRLVPRPVEPSPSTPAPSLAPKPQLDQEHGIAGTKHPPVRDERPSVPPHPPKGKGRSIGWIWWIVALVVIVLLFFKRR